MMTLFSNGAIVAVTMSCTDEEEKNRFAVEVRSLQALDLAFQGFPIDLSAVEIPQDPVGIVKIWREVRGLD